MTRNDTRLLPRVYPVDFLVTVLRVSIDCNLQRGRQFALKHLTGHPDFHEAFRLMIALEIQSADWFESSLRLLLDQPHDDWTDAEIDILNTDIYRKVMSTQWLLFGHRARLAATPPIATVDGYPRLRGCGLRSFCAQHWVETWKLRAVPVLLQGNTEQDPWDNIKSLMDHDDIGVCAECRICHLQCAAAAFAEDDELKDIVVREVKEEYGF